jgi:hypothetical protein
MFVQPYTFSQGGARVPALIVMPGALPAGVVSNGLFHASDWMPTVLALVKRSSANLVPGALSTIDAVPMSGDGMSSGDDMSDGMSSGDGMSDGMSSSGDGMSDGMSSSGPTGMPFDGIDMWAAVLGAPHAASSRKELLYNVDTSSKPVRYSQHTNHPLSIYPVC